MYSEITANKRKTVILMIFFVAFIAALAYFIGYYFGDFTITIGALIGSLIYLLISYFSSARIALAMNGARQIQKQDNPLLWRTVENLAITEGLPMPKVYIIDDNALNAFATGRDPDHASVAITTGLLRALEPNELEGVMAHELGHVKNYDIRVSMIVVGLVLVVSLLVDIFFRIMWFSSDDEDAGKFGLIAGLLAMILAPLVAALIQASISRKREYLADATGAMTTRYPEGLASALEKIKQNGSTLKRQNSTTAHLFFANPLKGKSVAGLFSTHPPIDERIARLRSMGQKV